MSAKRASVRGGLGRCRTRLSRREARLVSEVRECLCLSSVRCRVRAMAMLIRRGRARSLATSLRRQRDKGSTGQSGQTHKDSLSCFLRPVQSGREVGAGSLYWLWLQAGARIQLREQRSVEGVDRGVNSRSRRGSSRGGDVCGWTGRPGIGHLGLCMARDGVILHVHVHVPQQAGITRCASEVKLGGCTSPHHTCTSTYLRTKTNSTTVSAAHRRADPTAQDVSSRPARSPHNGRRAAPVP